MSNILKKFTYILDNANRSHVWPALAILVLTLIFFRNFMFTAEAPAGIDAKGFISRPWYLFQNGEIWSLWHSQFSFGFIRLPTVDTALAILYSIVNDPVLGLKIFAVGAFILSAASMYFVTFKYTGRKLSAGVSAVVFSSNQFLFSYYTSGVYNVIAAYCISPIIFYTFERMITNRTWRSTTLFSISFSVLCMFTRVDMATFFAPFLIFLLVCNFFSSGNDETKLEWLKTNFRVCLTASIMIIGLTSFLWLPMVMGARLPLPTSSGGFSNEDLYFRSLTLYETILGYGRGLSYLALNGEMWWNRHPFLSLFEYRLASSVLPILALIPILIKPNRKIVIYSLAVLLSIFLAKGPNDPFGSLYIWARNEIPFFGIYRIPNRWLLITFFFYSFLFGIGFQILWDKSHETIRKIRNRRPIRMISRLVVTLLMSMLLIALLAPITPILEKGFLTWDYPDSEKTSYEIISNDPRNFIVSTVPFAQGNINTSVSNTFDGKGWWEHDLGSESSLYHNKPAIHQTPAGGLSNSFVKFLKQVTYDTGDNPIMPILGNVGIKYVVNQSYPITDFGPIPGEVSEYQQHEFFRNQNYTKLVSDINEGSEVYENTRFSPFISSREGLTLVVGGKNSLVELGKIDPAYLNSGLTLISDIDFSKHDALIDLLTRVDKIIFVDSSTTDLAILASHSEINRDLSSYSTGSINPLNGWISDDTQSNLGKFTYSGNALTTKSNTVLNIPFEVNKSQLYEVWARTYANPYAGQLNFQIDDINLGQINPTTIKKESFYWEKLSELNFEKGKHLINIKNTKGLISNKSTLDQIVVVPKEQYQMNLKTITEYLETSNLDITILHTKSFLDPVIHGYPSTFKPRSTDLIKKDPSEFWNPFGPGASDLVEIEEEFYDTPPVEFPLTSRIKIPNAETPSYTFVTHDFDHPLDWTHAKTISFWFKGNGDGSNLYFLTKLDKEYKYYDFKDSSDEWREVIFELKNKKESRGQGISWDRVNAIGFGRQIKLSKSTFLIGPVAIGTIDVSSDDLPDSFVIFPSKDNYTLSILGATGPKYGSLTMGENKQHAFVFGNSTSAQSKNMNGQFYSIQNEPLVRFENNNKESDTFISRYQWKNTDPDNILITNGEKGATFDMDRPGRKYFSIAEIEFPEEILMPNSGEITLPFTGTGSGLKLNIAFYSGENEILKLSWVDEIPSLSKNTFEFTVSDEMKDSNLKAIKLSTSSKNSTGSFTIGDLQLMEMPGKFSVTKGVSVKEIIGSQDNNPLAPSSHSEYNLNNTRPTFAFLNYEPSEKHRDLSSHTHLIFEFKGSGTNQSLSLTLSSPSTETENLVGYSWRDSSTDWQEKIIELDYPVTSKGNIDWENVSTITLSTSDKSTKSKFRFSNVRLLTVFDSPSYSWVKSESPVPVKQSLNSEKLSSDGMTDIALIVAKTQHNRGKESSSIEKPKITFSKETGSQYKVTVESSQPSVIAFSQGYHRLWKANVDGQYIESIPLYSVINGFPIDKIGQYEFTIEFTGETFARYGGVVSLTFLILILIGCSRWPRVTGREISFSVTTVMVNIPIPKISVKSRKEIH